MFKLLFKEFYNLNIEFAKTPLGNALLLMFGVTIFIILIFN
jgi:hypothetical protein